MGDIYYLKGLISGSIPEYMSHHEPKLTSTSVVRGRQTGAIAMKAHPSRISKTIRDNLTFIAIPMSIIMAFIRNGRYTLLILTLKSLPRDAVGEEGSCLA